MIAAETESLRESLLAEGRGTLEVAKPLAPMTSLGIGGPAELFYVPADREDLAFVVGLCRRLGQDYFVLGGGTNLLVRDGGIRGLVLYPGPALRRCSVLEETETEALLAAEAGVAVSSLVALAARHGLEGLEFAVAIPGTVGGALIMNAGTPEGEVGDSIEAVAVVEADGGLRWLERGECGFAYRRSAFPPGSVVVEGRWRLKRAPVEKVQERMRAFSRQRTERQPIGEASAGSIFKNPPGDFAGRLIEEAGCKGLSVGRARVSEKHANFFINTGGATAREMEALIEEVRRRVEASSGIELELEIKIVGEPG